MEVGSEVTKIISGRKPSQAARQQRQDAAHVIESMLKKGRYTQVEEERIWLQNGQNGISLCRSFFMQHRFLSAVGVVLLSE